MSKMLKLSSLLLILTVKNCTVYGFLQQGHESDKFNGFLHNFTESRETQDTSFICPFLPVPSGSWIQTLNLGISIQVLYQLSHFIRLKISSGTNTLGVNFTNIS
jgi:hypothetical protein